MIFSILDNLFGGISLSLHQDCTRKPFETVQKVLIFMRFLDFSPLKSHHAPVAQWIERLTSNWPEGLKILSMGVNSVHPLDRVDQEQSIKNTQSILSIPIAPELHQEIPPST